MGNLQSTNEIHDAGFSALVSSYERRCLIVIFKSRNKFEGSIVKQIRGQENVDVLPTASNKGG